MSKISSSKKTVKEQKEHMLSTLEWETFQIYLLYDLKLSSNRSNLSALKHRFIAIQKYFSDKPFTRPNFTNYIAFQKERGMSPETLNKLISLSKNIAKYLNITDLEDFSYYKTNSKKDVDCLTWEEMDKISKVVIPYRTSKDGLTCEEQNHRQYCYIKLLSMVGCRQIEAKSLVWKDVHPDYVVFRQTKNSDDRYVPIKKGFYEELQQLPKLSDKVFDLSEVSGETNKDLKRRLEAIGVSKPIHNHIFRHSVVTHLLRQKVSDVLIAKLVGWNDINSVRRYEHLDLSDLTEMLVNSSDLWREDQTFEMASELLKNTANRIINKARHTLTIYEGGETLTLVLKKGLFS